MRSGTNRDLLFWSYSRCFECKNHKRGVGPIETSNSDANHVGWHARNDRWGLGHMETSNSATNHAVLHAQNER